MPMLIVVLAACGLAHGSGVGHFSALAPAALAAPVAAPVVAAHSSQYFERTFNRLVAAPVLPQPVFAVQPAAPVSHVHPVAPPPQVFVEPATRTVPVPVNPTQNVPVDPNVAIAIATAHAAAPVATILLPPYPFAPPPTYQFVNPMFVPEQKNESTTQPSTVSVQTTVRETEATTPMPLPLPPQQPQPSNTDSSFAQAPTTNQNTNFQVQQVYGPPLNVQPLSTGRLQKLRTSVEVVPVPLRYIAPPPIPHHHHHHHHHHHGHAVKYVHSFIPERLVVRPVHVHTVKVPAKLVVHRVPIRAPLRNQKKILRPRISNVRDTEPTTFKPLRPLTKPPRVV